MREYFPLVTDGQVRGVVGVWRDAAPILATLEAVRLQRRPRDAVRRAHRRRRPVPRVPLGQGRITRQTRALVDALDRDTLTGTLNHGALVDLVAAGIERARADRGGDRRRAHRHRQLPAAQRDVRPRRRRPGAADRGRHARAGRCPTTSPSGATARTSSWWSPRPGRSTSMIDVLERLRADARRPLAPVRRLRAPAADRQRRRLPVPRPRRLGDGAPDGHGPDPPGGARRAAATPSGWPAGRSSAEPETRTFDVFQGLIFAVDTKDRYTKQHSEDVARYGVFLAERLGPGARGGRHDPGRRAAPRRRQDRRPRRDPAQARQPDGRGVRDRQAARRARRPDRPRPARRRGHPRRRPPSPRALGRRRLPRPAGRRGDPAGGPDPRRRRRLLGDDHDPAVPQGARRSTRRSGGSRTRPARSSRSGSSRCSSTASRRRRTPRCPASTSGPSGCGRRTARSPDGRPATQPPRPRRRRRASAGLVASSRCSADRRRQRRTRPRGRLDVDDHADPVDDRGPPGDRRSTRRSGTSAAPTGSRTSAASGSPSRPRSRSASTQVTDDPPGTTWKASKAGLTTVTINTAERWRPAATRQPASQRDRRDHGLGASCPGPTPGRRTPIARRTARSSFNDPARLKRRRRRSRSCPRRRRHPTPTRRRPPTPTPPPTPIPTLPHLADRSRRCRPSADLDRRRPDRRRPRRHADARRQARPATAAAPTGRRPQPSIRRPEATGTPRLGRDAGSTPAPASGPSADPPASGAAPPSAAALRDARAPGPGGGDGSAGIARP